MLPAAWERSPITNTARPIAVWAAGMTFRTEWIVELAGFVFSGATSAALGVLAIVCRIAVDMRAIRAIQRLWITCTDIVITLGIIANSTALPNSVATDWRGSGFARESRKLIRWATTPSSSGKRKKQREEN